MTERRSASRMAAANGSACTSRSSREPSCTGAVVEAAVGQAA